MKKLIKKGLYFVSVFSLIVWSTGFTPQALAVKPDGDGDKITICHVTPSGQQITLEVSEEALAGHFDASGNPLHAGDHMGACIPPPEEDNCELVVTKSDAGYDPIMPGQELVYHLTIENIGEDECTGDEGVFLKDFYDENTSYVSDTLGGVVDHNGYLKWNLGVVNPGQMIELDLTMLVDEDTECDSTLENEAMWWFSTQEYGDVVEEETDVYCQEEEETSTIYAHKIVCEDESDLPNWSGNGPNITSTTAIDYVAQHPNCHFEEGWDFQWVVGGSGYAGDYIGPAPDWNSFDTTSAGETPAMKVITEDDLEDYDIVKIRENLQEGYIPFSFDPNGSNPPPGDDFSAEIWCHTDVLNYDNYDFIRGFEMDEEYYCVAFNVLIEEQPEECPDGANLIMNHSFEEPVVTNNSLWQKMSSVPNWAIEKMSDDSSTTLELHRGWSGNVAADALQYAELDGDHSTRIHQDVVTEEGAEYKLFWSFAPRHNIGAEQNHLAVKVDGTQVATNGPATGSAPLAQEDWTQSNYTFIADSTNTNIALEDIGPSDSYGTYVDNVRLCKIADPEEPPYDPYCGDGEINQEWEQCDSDLPGCSQHCQYVIPECNDLVVAKINMEEVINFDPASDMTDDIYLGSDSYVIPNNVWIALYWNGNHYFDPDISGYEDVPGLAVQRSEDGLRVVMYGTHPGHDKEHVHGNIEFYNATVTGQVSDESNDYPGNNRLENGFDGTGVGQYNAGNDEVWTEDDNKSFFWLTTTTADDGYYTEWEIVEDCENNICGMKFYDADQNGEYDNDDYNIAGWGITMAEKLMCEEGDQWADTVVDFEQGLRNNGTPVLPERSDPNNALGEAQDNDTINFVSLGFGGTLILGFDNLIENGDGNDVEVIETTYGSPSCDAYPEYVQVYASQDGNTWEDIGTSCLDGTFDLGSLAWAKYIKLVDITNPDDFEGRVADGYDVDGVRAIHCYNLAEETYETETGEDGYCFEDVPNGYYHVCEEIRDDWINTTPICQQVLLEGGQDPEVNFGNYQEIIEEPYCGDGIINQEWEQCDDGNNEDGDGCSAQCQIEEEPPLEGTLTICKQEDLNGDGILDNGEPVVPGWMFYIGDNEYLAENGCVFIDLPYDTYNVTEEMQANWNQTGGEGNGILESDGSMTVTIDGEMQNPIIYFLNQYTEPPEPFCGDGYVNQSSEQCDDGNNEDGDGCSATCTTEGGGGGGGFFYGSGNQTPSPYCGDNMINQDLEQCDDGNISNGDGCSSLCLIEEVLGVKIEPTPEVLGFKELPATGGPEMPNYNYLWMIACLMIWSGVYLKIKFYSKT